MWRLTPAVKRDDADDFGIAEPGACALYAKLGASLSGRRVTRQNRTPDGMAIFFTSDTHFGHGGALGLYRRPFASVAAVNEAIIERWNEIVGPGRRSLASRRFRDPPAAGGGREDFRPAARPQAPCDRQQRRRVRQGSTDGTASSPTPRSPPTASPWCCARPSLAKRPPSRGRKSLSVIRKT
jgi:hypothetical protein